MTADRRQTLIHPGSHQALSHPRRRQSLTPLSSGTTLVEDIWYAAAQMGK
jgi:hypothetical protein